MAYKKDRDGHIASGGESYLSHETWHGVQQAQGRSEPPMQMKSAAPAKGNSRDDQVRIPYPRYDSDAQSKTEYGLHMTLSGVNSEMARAGDGVAQRVILFDPETGTIIEIDVERPTTRLQSSSRRGTNYHTTAIIVAQDMLATNLLGMTYEEALDFIEDVTNDIVTMPGFLFAEKEIQMMILERIDEIHALVAFEAAEADPMNWAGYLERLCEMFVQTIDQLDYTYHEKGSGEKGSSGEQLALNLKEGSLGKEVDEKTILNSALKLIDLRKWEPKNELEAAKLVTQFMQKMIIAFPILAASDYLRSAIITIVARKLKLDPTTLYKLVDENLIFPEVKGTFLESPSLEVAELDVDNWNGRSLPDEAYKLFITKGVRRFNIGGMRLTIIGHSDTSIKYRIGPRGG